MGSVADGIIMTELRHPRVLESDRLIRMESTNPQPFGAVNKIVCTKLKPPDEIQISNKIVRGCVIYVPGLWYIHRPLLHLVPFYFIYGVLRENHGNPFMLDNNQINFATFLKTQLLCTRTVVISTTASFGRGGVLCVIMLDVSQCNTTSVRECCLISTHPSLRPQGSDVIVLVFIVSNRMRLIPSTGVYF